MGQSLKAFLSGSLYCPFLTKKHIEQENNATVLEEEGLGRKMSFLAKPKVILACIREFLEGEEYYKKTRRLRKITEELDGPASVRRLLEEKIKVK